MKTKVLLLSGIAGLAVVVLALSAQYQSGRGEKIAAGAHRETATEANGQGARVTTLNPDSSGARNPPVVQRAASSPRSGVRDNAGASSASQSSSGEPAPYVAAPPPVSNLPDSALAPMTEEEIKKEVMAKLPEMEAQFLQEKDPKIRLQLASSFGGIDDPKTVATLLKLLETETDPEVRGQLAYILSVLKAGKERAAEIVNAIRPLYMASRNSQEWDRYQEMCVLLETSEAADLLIDAFNYKESLPEDRIAAGQRLFRMGELALLTADELRLVNDSLRLEALAAEDPKVRILAIRTLQASKQDNLQFYREMLATESDSEARKHLEFAVTQALPPQAPQSPADHTAPVQLP